MSRCNTANPLMNGVAGFRIELSGVPFTHHSLVVLHVRKSAFRTSDP
jgi:hypothetical protein